MPLTRSLSRTRRYQSRRLVMSSGAGADSCNRSGQLLHGFAPDGPKMQQSLSPPYTHAYAAYVTQREQGDAGDDLGILPHLLALLGGFP